MIHSRQPTSQQSGILLDGNPHLCIPACWRGEGARGVFARVNPRRNIIVAGEKNGGKLVRHAAPDHARQTWSIHHIDEMRRSPPHPTPKIMGREFTISRDHRGYMNSLGSVAIQSTTHRCRVKSGGKGAPLWYSWRFRN